MRQFLAVLVAVSILAFYAVPVSFACGGGANGGHNESGEGSEEEPPL